MNGFAFFCGNVSKTDVDLGRVLPSDANVTCNLRILGHQGTVVTWGSAIGDIHWTSPSEDSFLLISGYILGARSGPDFRDHDHALKWCLAKIAQGESLEAIASWVGELRGSFAILYWNAVRNLTFCVTDRVASRPLWVYRQQSGWIVSSNPTAIARSTNIRALDPVALGSFLLYGGAVNPRRCLFRGIEGVAPGAIVGLDANGSRNEVRWYVFRHRPNHDLSLAAWVDLAAERLVTAASGLVRRGEKLAVFFSGGTDSRLAATALKAAGGNPLLVTLADSENLEVKVARLAARALDLPHKVLLRDEQWYLRSLPRTVYEAGGGYVWIHGHFAEAAAQIAKDFGVERFLLGDLCEAFSKLCCSVDHAGGDMWTPEEFANAFDTLRLPLYRPTDRQRTLSLLNASMRAEVTDGVRDEILEQYAQISSTCGDPLIAGDQCLRWNSVQTIPTYFMFLDLRSTVAEGNIMLDPDVHELLETLPSKFRNEMNLGAQLIRKLSPRAAWVMNSNSMLPMFWPPAAHQVARRIKPMLGRLRRSFISNTYRTTGSWPKHSMLYQSDPKWRRVFGDTLNQAELFDERIFDRDAIRQCWQDFIAGDGDRAGDIEKLAQIGMLSRTLAS